MTAHEISTPAEPVTLETLCQRIIDQIYPNLNPGFMVQFKNDEWSVHCFWSESYWLLWSGDVQSHWSRHGCGGIGITLDIAVERASQAFDQYLRVYT